MVHMLHFVWRKCREESEIEGEGEQSPCIGERFRLKIFRMCTSILPFKTFLYSIFILTQGHRLDPDRAVEIQRSGHLAWPAFSSKKMAVKGRESLS